MVRRNVCSGEAAELLSVSSKQPPAQAAREPASVQRKELRP